MIKRINKYPLGVRPNNFCTNTRSEILTLDKISHLACRFRKNETEFSQK